ncbi:hypothetical protein ACQ4LE_010323 [Meloidogyne hapla]
MDKIKTKNFSIESLLSKNPKNNKININNNFVRGYDILLNIVYKRAEESTRNKENQNKCKNNKKVRRHSFNVLQTNFLEKQFIKQRYINTEQRNKFSVKIWYQNRRYKEKIGIKKSLK